MIKRKSLKSQIIEVLWQLILNGELQPNQPLREVHLSKSLNISRTPLREALQRLEWEGIVVSEVGKGFRLAEFSEQEINEIYTLRAKLESYALELSGIPPADVIEELTRLNIEMQKTDTPKKLVELDECWHELLIANCPNTRLLKMIKILHRQSQRYEYAFMNMNNSPEISVEQHEEIITHLKNEDLSKAAKVFAENNLVGVEALLKWLKTNNN